MGPTGKEYLFDLRMRVPAAFPNRDAHPGVTVLDKPRILRFGSECHIGTNGDICVQMEPAYELDYERDGLGGFFQQVLIHLRRALIYALTGKYPGPSYGHAEDGKKEFRSELVAKLPMALRRYVQPGLRLPPDRQWCPCGGERRFKDCHKATVKAAQAAWVASGGPRRPPFRKKK